MPSRTTKLIQALEHGEISPALLQETVLHLQRGLHEQAMLAANLRLALDSAQMGIWEWELGDGRMVWRATLWERDLGTSFDELMGHIEPGDRAGIRQRTAEAIARGTDYVDEWRVLLEDGQVRRVTVTGRVVYDEEFRPVRMAGTARDITEQNEQARGGASDEEKGRRGPRAVLDIAEQLAREEDAERQEQATVLKGILEHAPVGYLFVDSQFRCAEVNPYAASLVGCVPEELIGRSAEAVFGEPLRSRDGKRMGEYLREAMERGEPLKIDGVLSAVAEQSGIWRCLDWQAQRIDRAHGRALGVLITIVDVTQHELAHKALEESEEHFRLMAETVPEILYIGHTGGSCSYISRRWYEYTGMPRGTALGLGWTAALHAEDMEDLRRQITRPVAAGEPYEVELRLRGDDGEYRWFVARCRPIYDEDGRITKWLGTCTDIDQLKRTGEALVASEGRNRALLRVIPDLIFRINSEGVIMDCVANREADLLLPPGRFLGKRLDVVLPAPAGQETMETIRRALRTGEMQIMEYALTLRGEARHYEARVVLAGNQEVLAIVRNVTERKQGEQRLRENQEQLRLAKEAAESANKAKDQFLAILSHELRTPLTPVLMSASVMEGNVMLPASIRDEMSMIRRNIELEARLIDDLLDLTRITRGRLALQLQCVDAHELVKQSCQMVRGDAEAKPLTLEMELAADAHHVRGDPARLQQVFCNLLKNAVKFTPAGGQVKIRSRRGENGRLRVEVSDTGIGIDEAMLPKLFHAFEQGDTSISRRFGGLGLGLTISKGLIDLHGGTVSASSDGPGKGAMFRVELPTVEPAQAGATAPAVAKHGPVQSRRILLVEDHRGTALVLARLLREAGHTVETAATVTGAMELVRMNHFDLLISDLALPDGSGVDLMRQIRAQHYDLKAIALTGHGMERDVADTRSVGFRIHLVKPIGFQQLEAAIAELTATE